MEDFATGIFVFGMCAVLLSVCFKDVCCPTKRLTDPDPRFADIMYRPPRPQPPKNPTIIFSPQPERPHYPPIPELLEKKAMEEV